MTAKEMFEKLGYEFKKELDGFKSVIVYSKTSVSVNCFIRFYSKMFECSAETENKILPLHIYKDELKAINRQCEELGWFDES